MSHIEKVEDLHCPFTGFPEFLDFVQDNEAVVQVCACHLSYDRGVMLDLPVMDNASHEESGKGFMRKIRQAGLVQGDQGSNPVLKAVSDLTGEGVDIAFDASGLQATLDTAIASVRPGGTIFNDAIHEKPLSLNLNDLSLQGKRLTGGICYLKRDFEEILALQGSGRLPAEEMITSVVPLSDIVKGGFHELMVHKAKHVKILIQPGV